MRRIPRPSHATVIAYFALFIAFGGTAMAAVVVSSNSQVAPNTISGHKPPSGKHANLIPGSINGQDVANESLTGADIKDQSGIQTCNRPLVRRFGRICEGSDGGVRTWRDASDYCTTYGLRLPTLGESLAMASKYVVDGVNNGDYFWTDNVYISGGLLRALTVGDFATNGTFIGDASFTDTRKTVCVANPTS